MPVYVSDLLTATAAPVSAAPSSTRTWQWLRGSTSISGATTTAYTATTDDIGSTISARQTETNFLGSATATSAATDTVEAYNPAALFRSSEPGVWYDPNDLTTLFQDAAGTTPVAAPGDAVGLMLDKSKGLVLGPEKVSNPGPFTATTGWSPSNATVSAVSNELVLTTTLGSGFARTPLTGLTAGRTYKIVFTARRISGGGGARVSVASIVDGPTNLGTTNQTLTLVFVAGGTTANLDVNSNGGVGDYAFSSISVKELPGNHATQATTANRPIYGVVPAGGRRNLLTWSESFDNVAWSKANTTATASSITENTASSTHYVIQTHTYLAATYSYSVDLKPNGRQWVTVLANNKFSYFQLSGAGGLGNDGSTISRSITPLSDGWYRCSITFAATAGASDAIVYLASANGTVSYAGDGVSGVLIRNAQLELGSTATPYQKVTNQYGVTEAGVTSCGYLFFDGVNDSMVTSTITPGTDKAQVFAGVRKLSDAAAGMLLELSVNYNTNVGSFFTTAPDSTGAAGNYAAASRGGAATNANQAANSAVLLAPISSVLTATHDIAGDLSTIRVNGIASGTNGTGDKGTGNYLAYPLYLGMRGGTSLPFNGQLFPLIVRFGPNLTPARISATESWVATKTVGVTL